MKSGVVDSVKKFKENGIFECVGAVFKEGELIGEKVYRINSFNKMMDNFNKEQSIVNDLDGIKSLMNINKIRLFGGSTQFIDNTVVKSVTFRIDNSLDLNVWKPMLESVILDYYYQKLLSEVLEVDKLFRNLTGSKKNSFEQFGFKIDENNKIIESKTHLSLYKFSDAHNYEGVPMEEKEGVEFIKRLSNMKNLGRIIEKVIFFIEDYNMTPVLLGLNLSSKLDEWKIYFTFQYNLSKSETGKVFMAHLNYIFDGSAREKYDGYIMDMRSMGLYYKGCAISLDLISDTMLYKPYFYPYGD